MSMTRKDFNAIAEIIRKYNLLHTDNLDLYNLATDLATYFRQIKPSFDSQKFKRNCGWYQE